jgi:hypothetical protein
MSGTPDFRDLSRLTARLKASLVVFMAVAAIGLWSGWLEIEILKRAADGAAVSRAEFRAGTLRQARVGVLDFLVSAVTGVLFLRWTYFSNRNARGLASGMPSTPGWAVGWNFVPVAAFWKPYEAFKNTFKASHPDFANEWHHAPHPRILPVWWTLWVIYTFAGSAALQVPLRANTIDGLLARSFVTFVSYALALPLGLIAMAVVAKLQTWQSEKRRRLVAAVTQHPQADWFINIP